MQTNVSISKYINTKFRDYAIYTIAHRGIPDFYDGLTNAQRLAILSAPQTLTKTMSLVGDCIKKGYGHGNGSLEGTISKLARTFSVSESILIGDGFFGSPVNHEHAAARYTMVKLNPKVAALLKETSILNEDNDGFTGLKVNLPFGLFNHITGIAVAYKSVILPRKESDIRDYINGNSDNELLPSFIGYTGKIELVKDKGTSTWVLHPVIHVDDESRTLTIKELPPLIKYDSYIRKLRDFLEQIDCKVISKSTNDIHLEIKCKQTEDFDFEIFKESIFKKSSVVVAEHITFIKDGTLCTYPTVNDYLFDFREELKKIKFNYLKKEHLNIDEQREYLGNKYEYLAFMLGIKRKDDDIDAFLKNYSSSIQSKLRQMPLHKLSQEELTRTEKEIQQLEKDLIKKQQEINKQEVVYSTYNPLKKFKKFQSNMLDEVEYNGMEVYQINNITEEENSYSF